MFMMSWNMSWAYSHSMEVFDGFFFIVVVSVVILDRWFLGT